MPLYYGDYAIITVPTSSVGVHALPMGVHIVTGIAAPAAAAGAKTFAALARCKVSVYCNLGYSKYLAALAGVRQTATCELRVSPVRLDGILRMRVTTPRGEVSTTRASDPAPWMTYYLVVGGNGNVWVDSILRNRVTLTGDLTVQGGKNLDGLLPNKVTLTGDLNVSSGTFLDGILNNRVSLTGTLTTDSLGGIARIRSVGNIAVLGVGTTHMPSALLQNRVTLTGALTVNYMRALLPVKVTASCFLYVDHRLAASVQMKQTPTVALQVLRAFQASTGLHITATARLNTPLRVSVGCKWSATLVPDFQRRIIGSTQQHVTASLVLYVGRYLDASVGVRQTASATPTVLRLLLASAGLKQSASASLAVAHPLSGIAVIRWSAALNLPIDYAPHAPIAEITVTPDMTAIEDNTSSVQVESEFSEAHVEE
jgi:hypothetical protein